MQGILVKGSLPPYSALSSIESSNDISAKMTTNASISKLYKILLPENVCGLGEFPLHEFRGHVFRISFLSFRNICRLKIITVLMMNRSILKAENYDNYTGCLKIVLCPVCVATVEELSIQSSRF